MKKDGGLSLRLVLVFALIAASSSVAHGQSSKSSLTGVIFDATGALIPGVDVAARSNATGAELKTISAENGTFSIPALDPGTYTVTAALPGFKQAVLNNVKLDAGVPATVRVTLEVGNRTETVEVQAWIPPSR